MTAIKTKGNDADSLYMLFRLLGTAHSVTELLDDALRELGMSAGAFRLLTQLVDARQPLEPHELDAAAIGADVGRLIDDLERERLVRRTSQSGTGRGVRLVITARGRARQHAAAAHIETVARQLAAALGGVDASAVERALSALRGSGPEVVLQHRYHEQVDSVTQRPYSAVNTQETGSQNASLGV
jgi:hypothetical protein